MSDELKKEIKDYTFVNEKGEIDLDLTVVVQRLLTRFADKATVAERENKNQYCECGDAWNKDWYCIGCNKYHPATTAQKKKDAEIARSTLIIKLDDFNQSIQATETEINKAVNNFGQLAVNRTSEAISAAILNQDDE